MGICHPFEPGGIRQIAFKFRASSCPLDAILKWADLRQQQGHDTVLARGKIPAQVSPRVAETGRPRSPSIQEVAQAALYRWPFLRHDRIACRVAGNVVSGHPMGSENPFEPPTDAFECGA
jgi:hypothetical protein